MTHLYQQLLSRFVFLCRVKQVYNSCKMNTVSYLNNIIHSFNWTVHFTPYLYTKLTSLCCPRKNYRTHEQNNLQQTARNNKTCREYIPIKPNLIDAHSMVHYTGDRSFLCYCEWLLHWTPYDEQNIIIKNQLKFTVLF